MDIMVDLETLGTEPGSVILSIGAVRFSDEWHQADRFFHVIINVQSSKDKGFTTDPKTVKWWDEQTEEAYQATVSVALDATESVDVLSALLCFKIWLGNQGPKDELRVWGNGASFDNALLQAAFKKCEIELPWHYWNDRCYRTLKNLRFYNGLPERDDLHQHHHALHDAIYQAQCIIVMIQQLCMPFKK